MTTNPKKEARRKVIGVPLAKSIQKDEKGMLIVRGYFTSDTKDQVGDIITRGATERAIPAYRQWGNIRRMHMPDPVGKVLRIGAEDGLEWNEVEIKVIDPKAVFEVENGLLTALSVGILINWEDIDFLEDGGWIISNYALAEISLVDHPANYDAKLKAPAADELRQLVREYGLGAVAHGMKTLLDGEAPMDETAQNNAMDTAPVEEPAEKDLGTTEAAPETGQPDVSAEDQVDNKEIDGDQPAGDEASPNEDTSAPAGDEYIKALHEATEALKTLAQSFSEVLSSLKVLAEAPAAASEQTTGEGDKSTQTDIDKGVNTETEPEAGDPANRTGATPETVLPGTDTPDPAAAEKEVTDLRQALTKYFTTRK